LRIGSACHDSGSHTKTDDLQNLISRIKNAIDLSSDAEEHIHSIATERQVSKGDVLIQEGQMVNKTYFVMSGSLRSFCTDQEGKDQIKDPLLGANQLYLIARTCWCLQPGIIIPRTESTGRLTL
jgi:CRP-like cAMP-binding protein